MRERTVAGPLPKKKWEEAIASIRNETECPLYEGLVVVPLFAGYDLRRHTGRLWKYDVTGGRYEEAEYLKSQILI